MKGKNIEQVHSRCKDGRLRVMKLATGGFGILCDKCWAGIDIRIDIQTSDFKVANAPMKRREIGVNSK